MRVEDLLGFDYSLDAWKAEGSDSTRAASSIAPANEEQLTEIERQCQACVERLSPLGG